MYKNEEKIKVQRKTSLLILLCDPETFSSLISIMTQRVDNFWTSHTKFTSPMPFLFSLNWVTELLIQTHVEGVEILGDRYPLWKSKILRNGNRIKAASLTNFCLLHQTLFRWSFFFSSPIADRSCMVISQLLIESLLKCESSFWLSFWDDWN